MNNYLVTVIFHAERFDQFVKAVSTMDAVNTVIDDLSDDYLDELKGALTIICKVV